MEDPEIPGRIQMERFIPGKICRKKSDTFRGITFFQFLPKRPKFSVPFAPCFDTTLPALLYKSCCSYAINWNFQSVISIRKGRKFLSKQGQPRPHVYSKVRILSPLL